jgi:hypothetical protein
MSWEVNTGDDRSSPVNTDLSAAQFKVVKDDGSGNLVLASAATDQFLGILQNDPKGTTLAPRVGSYRPVGVSKAVAGAAITVGQALSCDGSGRVITAVSGNVIGYARESAAAAGVIIAVDLARGILA